MDFATKESKKANKNVKKSTVKQGELNSKIADQNSNKSSQLQSSQANLAGVKIEKDQSIAISSSKDSQKGSNISNATNQSLNLIENSQQIASNMLDKDLSKNKMNSANNNLQDSSLIKNNQKAEKNDLKNLE